MLEAVESERPDVTFLVLFGGIEALLELTIFLETVLLCHFSFLLFGLHNATSGSEFVESAVEQLISSELTFERSVIDRYLDAWLECDFAEAFLTIGEYPRLVALEFVLESFANHFVSAEQIGSGDALAIGRIHHNHTLL